MKNKIKLDHVLIAVGDGEFEHYKNLSIASKSIKYKGTVEKERTWEACYIGLANGLYLEIVKKSKYPSTIGLALSGLGEEEDLLDDLKSHYPEWTFDLEKAMKDDLHWYNGYFSEQTETEKTFLWFMEYFNKFKLERNGLFSENIVEEMPRIYLSKSELDDLLSVVQNVPLEFERDSGVITIKDIEDRAFLIELSDSIDKRLSINI